MRPSRLPAAVSALALVAAAFALTVSAAPPAAHGQPAAEPAITIPRYDHVVIAVFENKQYGNVIDNPDAPYISSLANQGANFTQSYAITHPSQPNYLALFSGSTQGVGDDGCPFTLSNGNLGQQLIDSGNSFIGYSESMPFDGYTGCTSGNYARKHSPWVNWDNVPASSNLTFGAFPGDYSALPTLSYVIPDLCSDMHDCPVSTGDAWAQSHLDAYAQWAKSNNSLLILTFDEDDTAGTNLIPTVFVGQGVVPGDYGETIDHYTVLRTLEDMYGLPALGEAANRGPITDIW